MKGLLCICLLLFSVATGISQVTNEGDSLAGQIPPLRPPRAEIPPTFWEEHGVATVIGGALVLIVALAGIWFATRPKPAIAPPPVTVARNDLESLARQPEDGKLLSRVSQILRRYVTAAFELPAGEMTTTEFCRAISERDRLGKGLSDELTGFLRECDERKFAPAKPEGSFEAVPKALKLLASAETRREQMHQTGADLPPARGAAHS